MHKNRIEAFSDGVIAILITIMVLELKVPHGAELSDLTSLTPIFLSYILSFVYIAIYWNNHHHLFQAVKHVNGPVLWANMHLLFWLSMVPFVTSWSGENHFAATPVAAYGVVLLMCGAAYGILVRVLLKIHDKNSELARAIGSDFKGNISVGIYAVAIAVASWLPWMALAAYVCVALIWLIPDRRIEKTIGI